MHTPVTRRLATLALFGFALLGIATSGQAGLILQTPEGLTPGETFRFVFVTDDTTNAESTNISTYDAFVQADAGGATYNGVEVAWQAIGSTSSVSAIDHIGTNPGLTGVYLPSGTLVTTSDGTSGLWSGNLINPIDQTPSGEVLLNMGPVWTGTAINGTPTADPLGSTSPPYPELAATTYGLNDQSGASWIDYLSYPNNAPTGLYAISEVLTVPAASVPEPSTAILAGIGSAILLGVAAVRTRKERRRQRPVGPLDAIQ